MKNGDLTMYNKIILKGITISDLGECHENFKENYLQITMKCNRFSKGEDTLKVYFQRDMSGLHLLKKGVKLKLTGEIYVHSMNDENTRKNHTITFVICESFKLCTGMDRNEPDVDEVRLEGIICKKPTFRITAANLALATIILRVSCMENISYVPCIFWQKNANQIADIPAGTTIEITGRLQSRNYIKRVDKKELTKTTYEVSVSKITNVIWND